MIHSFYVIDAGLCIYHYDFKKETHLDDQLLSGFLTAIGSFAQEAFQKGLQSIQIQNGQKLNFYIDSKFKMIFCAISDQRDNNVLMEKILTELATRFVNMMGGILQSTAKSNVELFRDFDATLVNMLKNRDQKRTKGTMIKGSIAGIFTLLGTAIGLIILLAGIGLNLANADQTTLLVIIILYLSFGLPFSTYVGGKKAGSTHYGTRQGILFYVLLALLISYFAPVMMIFFIALAPIGISACVAAGYYGGLKTDQKKLYPLEKEESK